MHTIELSRSQVQKLVDHCTQHDLKTWFVAKDHGAYVGASAGSEPDQKCVFYFQGCDPSKDKDFYDTAHAKFGGDDFGERMPVADLQKALDNPQMLCVEVKVTAKSITLDVFETPASKIPNTGSAAVYYGVRKPNGKVGCVKKDGVEAVLLELCGGGQTTAQTAKAMEAGRELRETGSVTVKGYWIGPLGEV
jgi:hypothetical protein